MAAGAVPAQEELPMTSLNVAFIGAGRIANLHALGYRDNPKARLYAVCDARPQVAQARAQEWGAERWYTDYRRLLEDPQVDAVEVLTPHHLHGRMAIEALETGKHVSVQKPMCVSLEEADAMVAAARRSGRLLRVFENFRYYPAMARAKELLEAGEIGEPRGLRMKVITGRRGEGWHVPDSAWEWRFDPQRCGGGPAVFDHGYHMFSLGIFYLGAVDKVFAWISQRETAPGRFIDSPAVIIWKARDLEAYGSYEVVGAEEMALPSRYYANDDWVEITGSKGIIWVNACTSHFLKIPPLAVYKDGRLVHHTDLETDWAASFVRGTHDFIDAILEGRESQLSPEEGRETLAFALAALRSAQEGRPVRPSEL